MSSYISIFLVMYSYTMDCKHEGVARVLYSPWYKVLNSGPNDHKLPFPYTTIFMHCRFHALCDHVTCSADVIGGESIIAKATCGPRDISGLTRW